MKFTTQTGYSIELNWFKRSAITLTIQSTHPAAKSGYGVPLSEKDFETLVKGMSEHPLTKKWDIIKKLEASDGEIS